MEDKKSRIAGSAHPYGCPSGQTGGRLPASGRKDRRRGDHFVDHYDCSLSYGRKKRSRIRYLNWATELYGCVCEETQEKNFQKLTNGKQDFECDELINQKVRRAVEKLSFAEKQFVELFYFEFKTYREIAQILKKKVYKLERIHQRALSKLRIILADFAKKRFKLEMPKDDDCIICKSFFRQELDELIRSKKPEETYARLMRIFKQEYGINIKTPQVIIGHKKKHMV